MGLDVTSNLLGDYGPNFVKNLANSKIITLSIEYPTFVSWSLYLDNLLLKLATEKALLSKEEIIKLGNNIVETYLSSVLELSATLIAPYVQGNGELSGEDVIEDIELIFDEVKLATAWLLDLYYRCLYRYPK